MVVPARPSRPLPCRSATVDAATDYDGCCDHPAPSDAETTHAAVVHGHSPLHHPDHRQRRTHPTTPTIIVIITTFQTNERKPNPVPARVSTSRCPVRPEPHLAARSDCPTNLRESRHRHASSFSAAARSKDRRRCCRHTATGSTSGEDEFQQGIHRVRLSLVMT